jgi:streptogramin lyase
MTLDFSDVIYNAVLSEIEDHLSNVSTSLTDFDEFALPETNSEDADMQIDGRFSSWATTTDKGTAHDFCTSSSWARATVHFQRSSNAECLTQ